MDSHHLLCPTTSATDITTLMFFGRASETFTGFGNGFKNMTASLVIIQGDIESNMIWTETSNGDGGQIKFCVVMALIIRDNNNNIGMNFLNTEYKIDVDKTSAFTVTNIVAEHLANRDGGRGTIDYEEEITAFQCNDDYSKNVLVPPLVQGDNLQVCVKVKNTDSIFEVNYVRDMKLTQVNNNDSPIMVVSNRTDFA